MEHSVGSSDYSFKWSSNTQQYNITVKELIPIVLAMAIWGHQWSGKTVHARCDNAAVVEIVNSGSSKDCICEDVPS